MVRHFDCGGLRQLQNVTSVTEYFVTDEDLHNHNFLPIDLQCYMNANYCQFISHAIAMSFSHIMLCGIRVTEEDMFKTEQLCQVFSIVQWTERDIWVDCIVSYIQQVLCASLLHLHAICSAICQQNVLSDLR